MSRRRVDGMGSTASGIGASSPTAVDIQSGRSWVRSNADRGFNRAFSSRLGQPTSGFTLIEIIVVIVVLTLLATFVAPHVFRHVGTAQEATARSQIEMFGAALDAYRLDNGVYPSTAQGLDALWAAPAAGPPPRNWRGPYLRKEVPLDPWGNESL